MKNFLFLISCLLSLICQGQYKQGIHYYDDFQYAKAIPYLKKAANKNNATKNEATLKLADSYRIIKDYANAEIYYKKAIEQGNTDPLAHYNYGTVLKCNNKYDDALKEFKLYLNSNPTDARAKNAVKSFQDIKVWQSLPKEYEVTNLTEINTNKSEFSPVIYEDKLYYTSWQKPDLVNFEGNDFDGAPYLNIYYTTLKNDIPEANIKSFSKKINSQYHDGPITFSKQNELFITRVNYISNKKDKAFINRPQLYTATKSGKSWSALKPFPLNNDAYSLAHPSISDDGTCLFFSSDMPGGNGGMDIWVSKRNATGWDKPINLGNDINTPGNEEFPYIRSDGMLFFSSDALPGFGGLDVFSARQIADKWILNRNEGVGINSLADDFGIFFTDKNKGYISSNRDGGNGSDDIYKFTFTQKLITVDGTVLNSQNTTNPAKRIKVVLEDNKGNRLNDMLTNNEGYFRFENLSPDSKYMVKIDENDASFTHQNKYYYMDAKGEVMRVTVINEKGEKYVFRNLPTDVGSLPELTSPDDVTLAGNLLYGENPSKPIANKKVLLKDANGNVIDETTTNAFGAFVFSKIPADNNYMITLAEEDASLPMDTKITLTNKNGKEVKSFKYIGKGSFKFNLLAADKTSLSTMEVTDADLLMNLNGKLLGTNKKPLKKVSVFLSNDHATLLDTSVTDSAGIFRFSNLPINKNYAINIDENDAQLKNIDKIYITDLKDKVIREIERNRLKGYSFKILESEKTTLKDIYVEDPWLEVLALKDNTKKDAITIVENVYYALNAYKFDAAGQRVMDKVIQIMKQNAAIDIEVSSHTDAQGDDKNNLLLSQKRAKYAIDYMIAHGVDNKRLKAIGYGETKLINKCANNVSCTEEEHAKNRRTEFKIVDTGKK
jgi:outer membrane protein OmpA-like peptidoglycan-associated protein/tetratricopeptide (TPR) repeat protein